MAELSRYTDDITDYSHLSAPQVYLHIPGSEKLVLELPLVIGTIPFSGVGSRTSSMSSQDSAPSGPPSYNNIHQDLIVDGPRMPLLYDYDGGDDDDDMGLFIRVPEGCYPAPPAYSEVRNPNPNATPSLLSPVVSMSDL